MQRYQNVVLNTEGQPIVGASVTVKTLAGATASIFSDNSSTVAANPLTTDARGFFSFYAANGRYSLEITGADVSGTHAVSDILLDDETTETELLGNLVGNFYDGTHSNRSRAASNSAGKKSEFGVAPTSTAPTTDGNSRAGFNAYDRSAVDAAAMLSMTIDHDKVRFSSTATSTTVSAKGMSWDVGGTEGAALSTAGVYSMPIGGQVGTNPDSVTFTSTAANGGKTMLVGNSTQGESARVTLSCITSGFSTRSAYMVIDGQDNGALVLYLGATPWLKLDRSNNTMLTHKAFGYGGGAGGTATQTTSRTDPVTINAANGQITTDTASLAAGARAMFELTNSVAAAGDHATAVLQSTAQAAVFRVTPVCVGTGKVLIEVENISTAASTVAAVINFAVFKGSST